MRFSLLRKNGDATEKKMNRATRTTSERRRSPGRRARDRGRSGRRGDLGLAAFADVGGGAGRDRARVLRRHVAQPPDAASSRLVVTSSPVSSVTTRPLGHDIDTIRDLHRLLVVRGAR